MYNNSNNLIILNKKTFEIPLVELYNFSFNFRSHTCIIRVSNKSRLSGRILSNSLFGFVWMLLTGHCAVALCESRRGYRRRGATGAFAAP